MGKQLAEIYACLQPSPKVLVSCRSKNGEDNALAVAYCCNCSYDPPMVMVGIVPSRYSYDMIKEAGAFVVNIPGKNNQEMFDYLGSHSRRDGDKLKTIGAAIGQASKIDAPLLDDCPVQIECTIVDSIKTGSHEMFVGKILCVHADGQLIDEKGKIDYAKMELL
ncbi:MAG: flavin reductase family protein [Ruminococcaceae bacterium]|jgi:flavin reductase (DIM6/NTAB) family NADH-FMN oxidoreductase RutF|nr:flavin reductase family protein [Oscillospiraceae bacterium]